MRDGIKLSILKRLVGEGLCRATRAGGLRAAISPGDEFRLLPLRHSEAGVRAGEDPIGELFGRDFDPGCAHFVPACAGNRLAPTS